MIFVQACLFAVSGSVLLAIVLAFAFGGLSPQIANSSLALGAAISAWTFWNARHHSVERRRKWNVWEWAAAATFVLFSLRAFLWLVFLDGDKVEVLSPNNLGDLSLHITYIRELANGCRFWPENPIYAGAKLTYPVGVDLFHSLILLAGGDLFRTFIWMGLAGSLCSGIALWKWGGAFTIAGFLCNGGLAGFLFFTNGALTDFQSDLAWKSIPLALFVTQRGLLFALPAGLLLLCHWRSKFFGNAAAEIPGNSGRPEPILPWWGELLLYGSMPIFHVHTFLFLSLMLLAWFITEPDARMGIARIVAGAFLPATLLMLLVTSSFHGPSVLGWQPGWMQSDPDFLEMCRMRFGTDSWLLTFPIFWLLNFGVLPLFVGILVVRLARNPRLVWARAAVFPALAIFILCCFVKFAPWPWDNTKLMLWSYLAILPLLWRRLLVRWPAWALGLACFGLFWSGFASLLGGLDGSHRGYAIASREELDRVASAIRSIPVTARFIAQPDYNHPLLLLGRKLALGYTGHVWSHGYQWQKPQEKVDAILNGESGWRSLALELESSYLYWGPREREAYPDSQQSWRQSARVIASGDWGEIFDLTNSSPAATPVVESHSAAIPDRNPTQTEPEMPRQ